MRKSPPTLLDRLLAEARRNGYIMIEDAKALGISRKLLSNWAKTGKIQRVASGVYQVASAIPDEMVLLSMVARKLAFSHESALYLNGLSERCPAGYSVTIPSNATMPRFRGARVKAYYIKDELFGVGLERRTTPTGGDVPCYNAERTVCDILRSRSRIDEETLLAALRLFARSRAKDLNRLAEYSRIFRIEKTVHERLEVLL